MSHYLRGLAVLLLVAGTLVGFFSAYAAYGDEAYYKAAEALSRHPDHVLFQAEYYSALARHLAYIVTAVIAGLLALLGSAILFGISLILRRIDRLERQQAPVDRRPAAYAR